MDNVLFISKALNNMLPPSFNNWFKFYYNIHYYSTNSSMKCHLHKKPFRTYNFGKIFCHRYSHLFKEQNASSDR